MRTMQSESGESDCMESKNEIYAVKNHGYERRKWMIDYSKEQSEQLKEIEQLITIIEKKKKNYIGLPKGKVNVSASRGHSQYFFRKENSQKAEYVSIKDKEIIGKIIQREYEEQVLRELQGMQKQLSHFLKKYDAKALGKIYDRLCSGRKVFVVPMEISDAAYIKQWLEEHPGEQNPYPEKGKYETEQGEFVRSKSEKILADTLYKMKIPYRYEAQCIIGNQRTVYPDFTCLNVSKRKTIYWEHLGLMEASDYEVKNYEKIESYEAHGILLGDQLIISMETNERPFNVNLIRSKIDRFLK